MGKPVNGAVWLNSDMLSPYDYYQFWRNVDDADVSTLLRRFTVLPMDEIKKLEALKGQDINEAKKKLAFEATKLCHGEKAATEAQGTAQKVFEQGGVGGDLPSFVVDGVGLEIGGLNVVDLLLQAGLVTSKGEAKRLIEGGGARYNDKIIKLPDEKIYKYDFEPQGYVKLSAGKKKHALVKIK